MYKKRVRAHTGRRGPPARAARRSAWAARPTRSSRPSTCAARTDVLRSCRTRCTHEHTHSYMQTDATSESEIGEWIEPSGFRSEANGAERMPDCECRRTILAREKRNSPPATPTPTPTITSTTQVAFTRTAIQLRAHRGKWLSSLLKQDYSRVKRSNDLRVGQESLNARA